MKRVLRAARELEAAQAALSRTLIDADERELDEFIAVGEGPTRPGLYIIEGGLRSDQSDDEAVRSARRADQP